MSKPSVSSIHVKKVDDQIWSEADDLLASEEPLEIQLGFGPAENRRQQSISVTMRTPGNDFELALGFLFTEGIIQKYSEVKSIRYCARLQTIEEQENIVRVELSPEVPVDLDRLERHFYTTSSCGVCGKTSIDAVRTITSSNGVTGKMNDQLRIPAKMVYQLPEKLRAAQKVFEYTGGLHASALFDRNGNLILMREDVGRHNALDKLIGAALGKDLLPFQDHLILLSGRASFELIQKAAMSGAKIIAAVGAPSNLAVQLATEFRMTLIGFLRNQRFNIYCGQERIVE